MSAAGLNAYLENIGQRPTVVRNANSSVLVIDSENNQKEERNPADIKCALHNDLDVKEIQYEKLVWSQPLFTHNCRNNLLLFEIVDVKNQDYTPDPAAGNPYFCLLARPWCEYHLFDGNDNGAVYQTPFGFSYAAMMEYLMNNQLRKTDDIRYLNDSTPTPGRPWYYDETNTIRDAQLYFRYSPTSGFCIYATDLADPTYSLALRFFPCPYFKRGHFIHGFGQFDYITREWLPYQGLVMAYYAESMPTLLPTRYITITSSALNHDRTLQSFASIGRGKQFMNELAVFPVSAQNNNRYNSITPEDDGTTISFRENYTPQEIDIQILDENGDILSSKTMFQEFLKSGEGAPLTPPNVFQPTTFFVNVAEAYCAPWYMMNYLYFGIHGDLWTDVYDGNTAKKISAEKYDLLQKITYGSTSTHMGGTNIIHVIRTILRYS